jgi:SRSO17 transposase
MIVVAWVLTGGVGKVVRWATRIGTRHRTSLAALLTRSQWDSAALLRDQVRRELRRLRPRREEALELLIDDTRNGKRGRKIAALSKIWDHTQQCFIRGHIIVVAAVRFRGIVWPWQFDLWLPAAYAGKKRYRKITEMAAQIVRDFPEFPGLSVRVLFDAFYLSPVLTRACQARGFDWFSVAARNRNFTPQRGGRRRKLADWVKGFLLHNGQRVRMRRSRGWVWMKIASCEGVLSRIGTVRVVVSKRPRDVWKNLVVFVTNATQLKARAMVAIYEHRWDIEVLFKELKGTLGLGAYQVLNEQGICHHLRLCGLTHVWLTRHSLDAMDAKARKAKELSLPPLNQRLESLRAHLHHEQFQRVLHRTRNPRLRRKLQKCLPPLLFMPRAA